MTTEEGIASGAVSETSTDRTAFTAVPEKRTGAVHRRDQAQGLFKAGTVHQPQLSRAERRRSSAENPQAVHLSTVDTSCKYS